MRFFIIVFYTLFFGLASTVTSATIEADCDYPSGTYHNETLPSPKACEDLCRQNKNCRAFTFISGWKKCFLKNKIGKKFNIVMKSGDRSLREANGDLKIHVSKDHSGKDIKQVAKIKTAKECAAACQQQSDCYAFTFIDGYATCWLKSKPGQLRGKTFFCGKMPSKSL